MELMIIEKPVLDELGKRIETLKAKLDRLYGNSGLNSREWVDNQEACRILDTSKKKLQSLRNSGMLPFTRVGAKVYYRPEDIERLLLAGYSGTESNNQKRQD